MLTITFYGKLYARSLRLASLSDVFFPVVEAMTRRSLQLTSTVYL